MRDSCSLRLSELREVTLARPPASPSLDCHHMFEEISLIRLRGTDGRHQSVALCLKSEAILRSCGGGRPGMSLLTSCGILLSDADGRPYDQVTD